MKHFLHIMCEKGEEQRMELELSEIAFLRLVNLLRSERQSDKQVFCLDVLQNLTKYFKKIEFYGKIFFNLRVD